MKDRQGLQVTTESEEAVRAVDEYVVQVLSYGNSWNVIEGAVKADEHCVLAMVFMADYKVAIERLPEALEHVEQAKRSVANAASSSSAELTPREKLYVQAYDCWLLQGDMAAALTHFSEIVEQYPADLFALKRGQLLAFCLGDADKMLQLADRVKGVCKERDYFWGMLGFALEQNGKLEEAEAAGRLGTTINRKDAWSHHAVAHVLYAQGRLDEGIEWMENFSDYWKNCMSFMYTHNWFHVGLFYIDKEDFASVNRIYDCYVWQFPPSKQVPTKSEHKGICFPKQDKSNSQDQLGAAGFLWKWEIRSQNNKPNASFDERWEELVHHFMQKMQSYSDPFYDLLALYALGRTARLSKMKEKLNKIKDAAADSPSSRKVALEEVWVPIAQAITDYFTQNDAQKCYQTMEPAMPKLSVIGGSNEQREVFHDFFLRCAVEAKDYKGALEVLNERLAERPRVVFLERLRWHAKDKLSSTN